MLSITQTEALTLLENREIKTHQQVYTQEEEFFCTMWLSLIYISISDWWCSDGHVTFRTMTTTSPPPHTQHTKITAMSNISTLGDTIPGAVR